MPGRSAYRLRPVVLFLGTALVVALIGLLAAFITWRFHPAPKPPCVANCPPPTATGQAQSAPLAEVHSYRSSAYGYELGYPSGWSVSTTQPGAVAQFQTGFGLLLISGDRNNPVLSQLVLQA